MSHVIATEIARLSARCDTFVEDIQRTASHIIMETDASVARCAGRPTVKCEKCRVEVDVTKLNQPGRCMDRTCPLKQEPDAQ